MLSKTRPTIIWFCVLSFAAISGLGEGFHFLPGCGHVVPAGNTNLWMGALDPGMRLGSSDGVTRIERPLSSRSPTATADQCPICQHFSFASSVARAVVFIAVSAAVQTLPPTECPQPPPTTAGPFQARAPPHV